MQVWGVARLSLAAAVPVHDRVHVALESVTGHGVLPLTAAMAVSDHRGVPPQYQS